MLPLFHIRVAGLGACETVWFQWNFFRYGMNWLLLIANYATYAIIDIWLRKKGWTVLEWSPNIPTRQIKHYLWWDNVHPGARLVEDLIIGWIRQMNRKSGKVFQSILVIGDSTTAYCFDTKYEIKTSMLSRKISSRTGTQIWIGSVSGTSFTLYPDSNFTEQIRSSTRNGEYKFDAILLVGGWNQAYNRLDLLNLDSTGFQQDAVAAII
jgi:hypothetical protein